MRLAIILALLMTTGQALGQTSNLRNQVVSIIKDSSNFFLSFLESKSDTTNRSSLIIEGTVDNYLWLGDDDSTYGAYNTTIIGNTSRRKGQQVVDEWVDKLSFLTQLGFHLENTKIVSWNPTLYGKDYVRGNCRVQVHLMGRKGNTGHMIDLSITYYRP